jgi:hypothetical protein
MRNLSSYNRKTAITLILFCLFNTIKAQTCEDIFKKMFAAAKNVKTIRATINTTERIDDHVNRTRFAIKLNTSPYKAYSKDLDKGIEILYLDGQNGNEATINPNGFPYINIHLDPLGKTMRKDQHQTIKSLGVSFISDVLCYSIAKYLYKARCRYCLGR